MKSEKEKKKTKFRKMGKRNGASECLFVLDWRKKKNCFEHPKRTFAIR